MASSRESKPLLPAPGFRLTRTKPGGEDQGGAGGRLGLTPTAVGLRGLPGPAAPRSRARNRGSSPLGRNRSPGAVSPAAPAPGPS